MTQTICQLPYDACVRTWDEFAQAHNAPESAARGRFKTNSKTVTFLCSLMTSRGNGTCEEFYGSTHSLAREDGPDFTDESFLAIRLESAGQDHAALDLVRPGICHARSCGN